MNPNVWNIKEILRIPTGTCSGTKSHSRNGATSDYSSLTDSQFLFGSQYWPENSQGMSQEMNFSSRASLQSSQEASDPKISSNYHTKPFLFGGDYKEKGRVPNFPSSKTSGILERFEEDKKKAKDKCESDFLAAEGLQFRENIENMKVSLDAIEKNTTMCRTVLLEEVNTFAKTLQKNISSLQDGIALQFEAMLNSVSSQNETLREIKERVDKTGVATTELPSYMDNMQKSMETLRQEQCRNQNMLEEALSLLGTLISKHIEPTPIRVTDRMVQTSPGLVERLLKPEQSRQPDYRKPDLSQSDVSKPAVPFKGPWGRSITAAHKFTQRGRKGQSFRSRRQALLPPQTRSRGRGKDENSQPTIDRFKEEISESPFKEQDVGLKPEPLKQHNSETKSNKSTGTFLNPFSSWSQDSNSSQCIKGTEKEQLPAETTAEVTGRARGFWQLFDISYDSD